MSAIKTFWSKALQCLRPKKARLRTKLLVYFLLIFIIPTIILGSLAYQKGGEALRNSALEKLEGVITAKELSINNWLLEEKQLVELLASTPQVQEQAAVLLTTKETDPKFKEAYHSLSAFLGNIRRAMPDLTKVSILHSTGGRELVSTNKEDEGKYHLADSFFTLGREKTYVQKMYFSNTLENPTMTIATPIKNLQGDPLGVFFVHVKTNFIQEMLLERAGLGETGETFLVDSRHALVTRLDSGEKQYLQDVFTYGIHEALEGRNGHGRYFNIAGQQVVGFYRWLQEPRVALLAEITEEEALAPIRQFAKTLAVAIGLILSFTSIFAFIVARQISKPILAVADTASKVAKGDLSQLAPVTTNDEVATLANSFNRMTVELQELYTSLEDKVNSRTQKLELVAEIAEQLNSFLDLESVFSKSLVLMQEKIKIKSAVIYLFDNETRLLCVNAISGEAIQDIQAKIPIDSDSLFAKTAREGILIHIDDQGEHINHKNVDTHHNISEISVPIKEGETGQVLGILYVKADYSSALDQSYLNMLESIANQMAVAINNRNTFEEIETARINWEVTFNSLEDAVALTDKNQIVLDSNQSLQKISKQTKESLRGMNIENAIPSFECTKKSCGLTASHNEQRDCLHRIGNNYFEVHIIPITRSLASDRQKTARFVFILHDITQIKSAELELEKYADKLQRSNTELQEFAYVASHDLQEPLRKIQTFGDRLHGKFGDSLPSQGKDYLDRMQNAAHRMQVLINGLLSYSRVSTKAAEFEKVNLNKVVEEVLSDLEIRIQEVNGKIELEQLPIINGDDLQMRQLMQNLIGNALKFHKPDMPPVVKVGAHPAINNSSDPSTDYVEIRISDNGIGFDNKYADRIFGVFQRLHGKTSYEGSGIGLSVCRKIVQRHKGDIKVESQAGVGTTFTITLPLPEQAVAGATLAKVQSR